MWSRKKNVGEIKEDRNHMIGTTYIQVRQKTGRRMTMDKSVTIGHRGKTVQEQQTCNKTVRHNNQG
jgi:hypothetical protein